MRARPLAWTAIWAVALHCSLTMAYQGMLPMFVSMDLRAGAFSYGVLLSTIGLGAVIGSLALARFSDSRYRPALFGLSLVGSGASLSIMGGAPSVGVAVVSGFFVGSTQAMFMSMTLALIQGVVNTFVIFLARVVGYIVDKTVFRTERGVGMGFYITVFVCEILFGVLASLIVAWFSRQREFRADAASASSDIKAVSAFWL